MIGILFSTSLIFVLRTVVVTKLVVFGMLFSTSLIFVFRIVVVTKPLISGIFYQHLQVFFSKVCLSLLYWFMQTNVVNLVVSRFFF